MTMRPSPLPRSMTVSPSPTSAMRIMRSTISGGETTNGTVPSSQAQLCAPAGTAAQAAISERMNLKKVEFPLAPR